MVGCARSGTTLLQSLLAAHSQIVSFPESHFFSRLYWLPDPLADREIRSYLETAGLDRLQQLLPAGGDGSEYVRGIIDVFDAAARDQGASVWVEKTPIHLHHIDLISELVSRPRFIHILRNGERTIASLYKVTQEHPEEWGGSRTVAECVERWTGDIRRSLERAGHGGHLLVRYEELTAAPERVLRRICEFLSLPFEDQMVHRHTASAPDLILGDEPWKLRATTPIAPARPEVEGSLLTGKLRMQVEEVQALLDESLPVSR